MLLDMHISLENRWKHFRRKSRVEAGLHEFLYTGSTILLTKDEHIHDSSIGTCTGVY